ncbi:RluA family pseudouridine synthase [Paenibacillus aurantius]|uniref:Pseudouridine synthase n=1 Tax=Paenibacillus aurantius TaxID=2918900 RepID=A0AA96RC75_9BACL|nr:RluA family pseudouridine synthase [Paenibacillus aurantius]WNQ10225.1 RluA family pseudouridine synthase [Paenibacillus aurantius]
MSYYDPLVYVVPPEEEGMLLKTILQNRLQVSRKLLSRLKLTEEGITVNGRREYISIKVRAGDRVEVRMAQEESDDILPEKLPLAILHEDAHVLVVNKPAGMIVHPTHGHYTGTLANAVVHHWKELGETVRFRPVHRLDQETSGVLCIAKNPYVHQNISEQMKANQVKKEYLALVYGLMKKDEGTVDAPIDRNPEAPHIRIVTPAGYRAVTHYRTERRYAGASLVRLWLETGRTHQIRVHMKHIGHALLGDKMYLPGPALDKRDRRGACSGEAAGGEASQAGLSEAFPAQRAGLAVPASLPELPLARQALHAAKLGFYHPGTRQWVEYEAPLPEDMTETIRLLERQT